MTRGSNPCPAAVWISLSLWFLGSPGSGGTIHRYDFSNEKAVADWSPAHDVGKLKSSPEGMRFQITGSDPFIIGPSMDYPIGQPLWLNLRMRSEVGGHAQIFYFPAEDSPSEENSVRFPVSKNKWVTQALPLPPLGKNYRIRFDPPGSGGSCTLASIEFEARAIPQAPEWPVPRTARVALSEKRVSENGDARPFRAGSGKLEVVHGDIFIEDFVVVVDSKPFASGSENFLVGYLLDGETRWIDSHLSSIPGEVLENGSGGFKTSYLLIDPDGGNWRFERTFTPAGSTGAIQVDTTIDIDQDREVLFLPIFTLYPGLGSFGRSKGQGLFAGLEYLANEPSSSTADLTGPESQRQIPDRIKITFPLMAIQNEDRWLGMAWDVQHETSALFDSPDRLFGSNGHLMGLSFPGTGADSREPGSLVPHRSVLLRAGHTYKQTCYLLGGEGKTVVPAIQKYLELYELPPTPDPNIDFQQFVRLMGAGWVDSRIRKGDLFFHALGLPNAQARPSSDAAMMMEWLGVHTQDEELRRLLTDVAGDAIKRVPPSSFNSAKVSHIRYPVESFLYGNLEENLQAARKGFQGLWDRFHEDGTIHYQYSGEGPDYGKTHWAPHSNGLTAGAVLNLLETAAFVGDQNLIDRALERLRGMSIYKHTVPRGAQTWEIPLHTPDILASARLLRAYTLGYELTWDAEFLDEAKYWAWTGVPFVYLVPPTQDPIAAFSTTPVYGATGWKAPVWMGLPVQWCGLVYSHALYQFARFDPKGPWKKIADGITASGIQQTWPADHPEYAGLLADSMTLRTQTLNRPAINPGTLMANAVYYFNKRALYDFHSFPESGLLLHAPGAIDKATEKEGRIRFSIDGWFPRYYLVLVNRAGSHPKVQVNGQNIAVGENNRFDEKEKRLVLRLEGTSEVELVLN